VSCLFVYWICLLDLFIGLGVLFIVFIGLGVLFIVFLFIVGTDWIYGWVSCLCFVGIGRIGFMGGCPGYYYLHPK
jgi:hypothetical protein